MLSKPRRKDGSTKMYCGPAALCAITGKTYEEVRAKVNVLRHRKPNQGIIGMHNYEMVDALRLFGWATYARKVCRTFANGESVSPIYPTLAKFLKNRTDEEMHHMLLINITGHYVTVYGNMLVDNHTTIPVHLAIAPHKKCRVKKYWIIK